MATPASPVLEIQIAIQESPRLLPRGGGSKPGLSTPPEGAAALEMGGLSGLLEYEPQEFTFSAYAGTSLAELEAELGKHGQYLPFDPPFTRRGATLGGTVAAGLSGPGRYRSGGVRDFILGVGYLDCAGQLVRAGGRVVKNAAGFDLAKLMVGSLGGLGALVELTFKVLPKPEAFATLSLGFSSLAEALAAQTRLSLCQLDLFAIDLVVDAGDIYTILARLGGFQAAQSARIERLQALLPGGALLEGEVETALWEAARELDWSPPGNALVKVPLTPGRIPELESALVGLGLPDAPRRRYTCAGQAAWVSLAGRPDGLDKLDAALRSLELAGLAVLGPPGRHLLGVQPGASFARRVKQALDPLGKFGEA